ncbi:MAG: hypothetical protein ABI745_14930 [Caldimonas sp.]
MPVKPSLRTDPDRVPGAPSARRGSLRWVREVLGRTLRLEQPPQRMQAGLAAPGAQAPLSLVMQQRAELGARLLVHDPATQVVRHLFIIHDELRNGGWAAVEALPPTVIARALAEAEILAADEPSPLLATISAALAKIMAAAEARTARDARAVAEAEWEIPRMPEVSDTNFDEYELMERSWAGTVPSGLREATRDTR